MLCFFGTGVASSVLLGSYTTQCHEALPVCQAAAPAQSNCSKSQSPCSALKAHISRPLCVCVMLRCVAMYAAYIAYQCCALDACSTTTCMLVWARDSGVLSFASTDVGMCNVRSWMHCVRSWRLRLQVCGPWARSLRCVCVCVCVCACVCVRVCVSWCWCRW